MHNSPDKDEYNYAPLRWRDNHKARRLENQDPDMNKLPTAFDVTQSELSLVLRLL